MNFQITFLTLNNIYFSIFKTQNNLNLNNCNFNKIFSTFFIQNKNLKVQNTIFFKSLNSILYLNNLKINNIHYQSTYNQIYLFNEVKFQFCTFSNIINSDNHLGSAIITKSYFKECLLTIISCFFHKCYSSISGSIIYSLNSIIEISKTCIFDCSSKFKAHIIDIDYKYTDNNYFNFFQSTIIFCGYNLNPQSYHLMFIKGYELSIRYNNITNNLVNKGSFGFYLSTIFSSTFSFSHLINSLDGSIFQIEVNFDL